MTANYLTAAETAKLVRLALKKNFPAVKFSVTSKTYSGGASIDVGWDMGPTTKEVERIAKGFEGGDFDGSIDMKITNESWVLPDGSACLASSNGTTGSMGFIPSYVSDAPHPNARLVRFAADFVFCNRHVSDELSEQISRDMCALQKVPYVGYNTTGLYGSGDQEYITQHVWQLVSVTHFAPGEVYAGVRYKTEAERNAPTGIEQYYNLPMAIIKKQN